MSEKPTLVIGDLHGHMRRLEALLLQEGILGPCEVCGGSGDVSDAQSYPADFCPACKGAGTARLRHDVRIIQLGDLIDARWDSQSADSLAIHFADQWVDDFTWGNHDRPVIDHNPYLRFGGYATPLPEVIHRIKLQMHQGRWKLAYRAHGFLITHAGVPEAVTHMSLDKRPEDPEFADYLNYLDREVGIEPRDHSNYRALPIAHQDFLRLRDKVSPYRGGRDRFGGILWRDAHESLYPVPQIFGHTSDNEVHTYPTGEETSYCIDVSKSGKLGAIWLPEKRIVEVDPANGDLHLEPPVPDEDQAL